MSVTRSSEPAVLHREGPDLDALVEEIAAEHPVPVRFLDVDRVRRGGVMGFFAKEQYALSYQVEEPDPEPAARPAPAGLPTPSPASRAVDLDALLGSADAHDVRPGDPLSPSTPLASLAPVATSFADDRFAALLVGLAAEDVASGRHRDDDIEFEPLQPAPIARHRSEDHPVAEPVEPPVVAPAPVAPAPAPEPVDVVVPAPVAVVAPVPVVEAVPVVAVEPDLTDLSDLGVPTGWPVAAAAAAARLAALAGAVLALPPAPTAPTGAGELTVLLGVDDLDALLPGDRCTAHDVAGVRRAVAAVRAADRPGVLVLDPAATVAPGVLAAVAAAGPDLVLLTVEATGKTGDHRRRLETTAAAGLRVDAIVVGRAAETSSPASVWELGRPVFAVDGRRSDLGTWLALLVTAGA